MIGTKQRLAPFRGDRLKELRQKEEIKQPDLASYLVITPSGLSRLENRHNNPRPSVLKKICARFSKDESFWYEPDASQQAGAPASADPSSLGPSPLTNRSPSGRTAASDGLDYLPHRWLVTNHSDSQLQWVEVEEKEAARVSDLIRSHYGKVSTKIISPAHVDASQVYGVFEQGSRNPSIFLKMFRENWSDDQLSRLLSIHDLILKSSIFPEKSAGCLRPLNTIGHKAKWIRASDGRPAMAFPFLDGTTDDRVSHFRGASRSELIDVGRKLGHINNVLSTSDLSPTKAPSAFVWDDDLWDSVCEGGDFTKEPPLISRRSYILKAELDFIKKIRDEIRGISEGKIEPSRMTLHDFHPHNVFVSDYVCILVVDFEGVRNDWPEEGTMLFALHRFCREYVRQIFRTSVRQNEIELTRDAAAAFLEGYREKRDLNFTETGIIWAQAINFAKLMDNLAYGRIHNNEIFTDSAGRTEEKHYREVIKFISYLKELEIFRIALGGL